MNIHVLRHLKEELAWAIDKRLQFISYLILLKTFIPLKKIKNKDLLNLKQYCIHCYMALSNVF